MKLTRITTIYDGEEDRFHLLGTTLEDESLELWITQRLLGRMVKVLLEWLEGNSKEQLGSHSQSSQAQSSVQTFAQQNANAAWESSVPVEKQISTESHLLGEVDIQRGDEHVVLVFKLPEQQVAELLLDSTHLRQWLTIVMAQWINAEWPADLWPQWMQQAGAEVEHSGGSLSLH